MLLREYKHLVGKQEAYDKCKAERQYDLRILLPSSEICNAVSSICLSYTRSMHLLTVL